MSTLKPLPSDSQLGCDVLFFDSAARQTDLWECANLRLSAAEAMLRELATCTDSGLEGSNAMPAVAEVCALLMSDARGMLEAIGQHLIKQEVAAINGTALKVVPLKSPQSEGDA